MTEVSASLKAARAVDGDDWFVARMKVLCITGNIEYSQRLAYLAALSVAPKIAVDEFMTVTTSDVTDEQLQAAVMAAGEELGAIHAISTVSEQLETLAQRLDALDPTLAIVPEASEALVALDQRVSSLEMDAL